MWVYNNAIYHSGIKGMRWGVRRYQNTDGSLTPAGRKRYGSADGAETISNKLFDKTIKRGKDKEPLSPAEKIASDTSNALNNLSQAHQTILDSKNKRNVGKGIDSLSNKELQELITRMNLEKQYKNLSSERIKEGSDRVSSVLNVIGNVVGITASTLGVITTIKGLKGGS